MEKTKKCAKCKKTLPIKEFPKDSRAKDKLWRFCRACESARKKAQRLKSKTNAPQTKPITKKSKKGSAKKSALKIYFRTKCAMTSDSAGEFSYDYGSITGEIKRQHISIFLPRISKCLYHSFNDLFAEVVSHEYLHYVILKHVGIEATTGLDNLFGHISKYSEVGTGLSK